MTTIFHPWSYSIFTEIQSNLGRKKIHKLQGCIGITGCIHKNQGCNLHGDIFSNRGNLWAPIQFGREIQPQNLKRCFLLRNKPIHFQKMPNSSICWNFLDISSATTPVARDLLKALTVRASVVDQEELKICWKLEKRPYFSRWSTILLFTCFTNILLTTESRPTVR